MNAFVVGATGYTGREVVRQAAQRARVTAHVRPDSGQLAEWRTRFEALGVTVDATPWERGALTAAIRRTRPAVVFALLGTTRARGGDYEGVDYGLTRLLLDAVLDSGVPARFVYLSSVGVSPGARGAYLRVRARFEQELAASGLRYIIARPSFITGPDRPGRRPLERWSARVADAILAAAGRAGFPKLSARFRSTNSTTLAAALVRLAFDDRAPSRVYESEELRT